VGSDGAPQSTLQVPGAGSASLSRLDIEVTDTGFMLGGSVTVTSTAKGQTNGLVIPQFVALSFLDNADRSSGRGRPCRRGPSSIKHHSIRPTMPTLRPTDRFR
jgi:hypothetical protein